jgi:hypothetical protein
MRLALVPDIAVKWDKRTNFLPECIESDVMKFYEKNRTGKRGLITVDTEHRAILTL